jgi:ATP-dependent Clp protease protease subunit
MQTKIVASLWMAVMLLNVGCSVRFDYLNESNLARQLRSYEVGKPVFDPDDPLLQNRVIMVPGELNFSLAQTVCQQLTFLNDQSRDEPITMLVNSTGGDGSAYQAISNMVRSISAPVDIVNFGMCASYAATLVQSATGKRIAQKNSIFLIHDIKSNNGDFEKFYSEQQLEIFKTRCSLPEDWLPLKKDHTFTADDALKYNFVDEVVETIEI